MAPEVLRTPWWAGQGHMGTKARSETTLVAPQVAGFGARECLRWRDCGRWGSPSLGLGTSRIGRQTGGLSDETLWPSWDGAHGATPQQG